MFTNGIMTAGTDIHLNESEIHMENTEICISFAALAQAQYCTEMLQGWKDLSKPPLSPFSPCKQQSRIPTQHLKTLGIIQFLY